ncbi:MAG: AAA family ATPase [Deltaproteobacteria bacterium]|nr:AAA family ATPase [Deltaproteobacteria bacterium]
MLCPQCQSDNRDGAKFCSECGTKFAQICTNCQAQLRSGAKFCDECGHKVGQDKSSVSSATPQASPSPDFANPLSYTPKPLAEKILAARSSMEGERKIVTVFFSDVAGFTPMVEKFDPEEVHGIMEGCFKISLDEIHKYEGTVVSLTGDGIMALFGAPLAHEDHARRACLASLNIQRALKPYAEKIKSRYGIDFKMRIGLDSGPVVVGTIWDNLRVEYAALGDTVNTAARMQSLAPLGGVLVTVDTYRLAKPYLEFVSQGSVKVKGKENLHEVYELVGEGEAETRIQASKAKGLTRFIGRQMEMDRLLRAFDKVKSGVGQMVGIMGEAGVGKSRLLLELRQALPAGEFTLLQGQCLQFGRNMPYLPILDILRSYFDLHDFENEGHAKNKLKEKLQSLDELLLKHLSSFYSLLSLTVEDDAYRKLEPKNKRDRDFEAVKDLLVLLSRGRPLVLVVEDLHWMDKASEQFLDYLIGSLTGAKILLILLYRPEYNHQWASKTYYRQVSLDQLPSEESADLVMAILEGGEVSPELRELILDRAAGNPLFMEELTHNLVENGTVRKEDNKYVLCAKSSEIHVPDTIQGIIAARIDRLEDNMKRTMQVAAVIGRDFAFRLLKTITDLGENLKSVLLILQGLEFIYEKSLFPDLEYIFKHALIQEVAYDSLLVKRRKYLHERIGQAIEQIYSDRLEEFYEILGYHYSIGENNEKAGYYLRKSGEKAIKNYLGLEGLDYFEKSLSVLRALPETLENKQKMLDIILLMRSAIAAWGWHEDSYLRILDEGEQLARSLNDERSLLRMCSAKCLYFAIRETDVEGIDYLEDALKLAIERKDDIIFGQNWFELVFYLHLRGSYGKIIDITMNGILLLELSGHTNSMFETHYIQYCLLLSFQGLSFAMLGDFSRSQILFERAIETAKRAEHLATISFCTFQYALYLFLRSDWVLCRQVSQHVIESLEKLNKLETANYTMAIKGVSEAFLGQLEQGRRNVDKGLQGHQALGHKYFKGFFFLCRGIVSYESKMWEESYDLFCKSRDLSNDRHERRVEGLAMIWLGRTLIKMNMAEHQQAIKEIKQGLVLLEGLDLRPDAALGMFFLGEAYMLIEDKDNASGNLDTAAGMFQGMGMTYWLGKTNELLTTLPS